MPAHVNQIPTREKHEAMRRARLTTYTYDEVVAAITEANAVNARYAELLERAYAPWAGWKFWECMADPQYNALSEITRDAYPVDARGATRHSREAYPIARMNKDTRRLRRVIEKLEGAI